MYELKWPFPSGLQSLERVEELEDALDHFPNSPLANVWKDELAYLYEMLSI